MFEESDQNTGLAVGIAVAVAIVVTLLSIAMATFVGGRPAAASAAAGVRPANAPASIPPAAGTAVALYFAVDEASLSDEAVAALAPVIAALRADPAQRLAISGYHDKTGDPGHNIELAKQRAFAVRDLLLDAGIAEERLILDKPRETLGGPDDREARRVDVSIR